MEIYAFLLKRKTKCTKVILFENSERNFLNVSRSAHILCKESMPLSTAGTYTRTHHNSPKLIQIKY